MTSVETDRVDATGRRRRRTRTNRVPRSRGAISGLLLVLLGIWGGLVPFIGPYLDYSYGSDKTWHWTAGRGWLEVLPGAVCLVGGLLVLTSKNRIRGSLGAWLAVLAGAWFVIGKTVAAWWHTGGVGEPVSQRVSGRAVADLGYFYGLGAVILFLAAFALGRLAVVSVRDIAAAERDEARAAEQAEREAELARERDRKWAEAREAETARQAELERKAEADRQVELERKAEADRTEAERAAAGERQADKHQIGPDDEPVTAPQRTDPVGYNSSSDYNPLRGEHSASQSEYDSNDGGNSIEHR